IIGNDGGKGKTEQGNRQKSFPHSRKYRSDGVLSKRGIILSGKVLHNRFSTGGRDVVLTCNHTHKSGCSTNQQSIEINRKGLHQPLFGRMRNGSRCCCVWSCSLPCFVGINSTFYTPRNSCSDDSGKSRFKSECRFENELEHRRNLSDVESDDNQSQ